MTDASTNPVVRLCAEGIAAEALGRLEEARALYEQAWQARMDSWDACVAAHYVARHQESLAGSLHWNQKALRFADATTDDRVRDFRPSLHLNVAHAHELMGDSSAARHHYERAQAALDPLPRGEYREMLAKSIENHLRRVSISDQERPSTPVSATGISSE